MKLILINPRDPIMNNPHTILQQSMNMIPLGILYIATFLKLKGYSVSVLDLNSYNPEECVEKVLDSLDGKNNIVGISISTTCYKNALYISKIIKNYKRDSLIVWGGYHPTFCSEECLNSNLCDIVIRGEGEFVFEQIASLYYSSKLHHHMESIPSISYKNKNGKIIHNQPMIYRINDINNLPIPDRSILDTSFYSNPSTMIASRGCIGECVFCASAKWGLPKIRDHQSVIDEIDHLVSSFLFDHITFVDNVFAFNESKSLKLLEIIGEKYKNISFSAEVNINFISKLLIKRFYDCGLKFIQFGVESGNNEILHLINKGITTKQVESIVEYALLNGLNTVTSFIIGHPEDTYTSVLDTIKFATKLKRLGAQIVFSYLIPFPGSQVYRDKEKLGVKIIDPNYENWAFNTHPCIETRNLDNKTLMDLMCRANYEINSI